MQSFHFDTRGHRTGVHTDAHRSRVVPYNSRSSSPRVYPTKSSHDAKHAQPFQPPQCPLEAQG